MRRTPAAMPPSLTILNKPMSPERRDVRAAAELRREVAELQHAHLVAVLVAEERERAGGDRFVVGQHANVGVVVQAHLLVDERFDLLAAARRSRARSARSRSAAGPARRASLSAGRARRAPCAAPRATDAWPSDSARSRRAAARRRCAATRVADGDARPLTSLPDVPNAPSRASACR